MSLQSDTLFLLSQLVFALTPQCCMFIGAANKYQLYRFWPDPFKHGKTD